MMSDFIPANMTGRLFDRRHEKASSKQPDYTGTVNIDGVIYRVASWYNPPSESCKVATHSVRLETESQYQDRLQKEKTRREKHASTGKRSRGIGYSESKYPRY